MQGYTTLAAETLQQLEEQGAERPTHLFLQAGVGSFAGAALGFFTSVWGEERPVTAIVEPDRPTACSAPPRPTTGRCTSSLGTWTA